MTSIALFELLKQLHSQEGIGHLISTGGLVVLFLIIFAEKGLLIGFFLPGDSLLIMAGVLSNPHNPNYLPFLNIGLLNLILITAAILGDQTGFFLGTKASQNIWQRPDGRFFKKKHLQDAHEFYEKSGAFALVASRFVPILRTFVPFVAGLAKMSSQKFLVWNIVGAIIWVPLLTLTGYALGQSEFANRIDKIIVIVIIVSVLPLMIKVLKKAIKTKTSS